MNSATVVENGGETVPPFNVGTEYEAWTRIATLMVGPEVSAVAVVLEAPDGVETTNPYVFLFRSTELKQFEIEDVVEYEPFPIVGPSMFYLASHIAAQWGYTDVLDEIPEEVISGFLATLFLKAAGSPTE